MKTIICLMSPENSGNIGAIARVMANFGVKELIIINPKAQHLNKEALDRSSHAKQILKTAEVWQENNMSKIRQKLKKKQD